MKPGRPGVGFSDSGRTMRDVFGFEEILIFLPVKTADALVKVQIQCSFGDPASGCTP